MTTEERLEAMERALARTQGSLRRMRRMLGLGGLLLLGGLSLAAVRESPVIHAKAFVLTDAAGRDHAILGLRQGGVGLELTDDQGRVRTDLAVGGDASYLRLIDSNGKIRAALGLMKKGAALTVFDPDQKVRAGVGDIDDHPNMCLFDAKGGITWQIR